MKKDTLRVLKYCYERTGLPRAEIAHLALVEWAIRHVPEPEPEKYEYHDLLSMSKIPAEHRKQAKYVPRYVV